MEEKEPKPVSYEVLEQRINELTKQVETLKTENNDMKKVLKSVATQVSSEPNDGTDKKDSKNKITLKDIKEALL